MQTTASRVTFTIPGEPIAQGRPRAANVAGHVRVYQPARTVRWQEQVRLFASQAMAQRDGEPFTGPVALSVSFYLPRPARLVWKNRPMPPCPAPTKPDLDNLVKAILDGINHVVVQDDRLVAVIAASKFYPAGSATYGDTRARVEVEVVGLAAPMVFSIPNARAEQGELMGEGRK